jgi:hypothetical protein
LRTDAFEHLGLACPLKVAPAVFDDMIRRMVLKPLDERDPQVVPVLRGAWVLLVPADVPDVPFAGEGKRLTLRQ